MTASSEIHGKQNLSTLMQELSVYLDDLLQLTHRVENAVSDQHCLIPSLQENTIKQLQSLDYIRQALNDLATLTLILGECGFQDVVSSEIRDEMMEKLNLNDVKLMVCKGHKSFTDRDVSASYGDFDFFDRGD